MIQGMKSHYSVRIKDGKNNAGRRLEAYFSKKCAADSSLGGHPDAARMITLKNGTTILYKREQGLGHGPLCEDRIGMYVSATPEYMKRAVTALVRCIPKEDVFVEQLSEFPKAKAGKTANFRENIAYDDGFTSGMEYLDSIMTLPKG